MKVFLDWMQVLLYLLIVAFFGFFIVANFTGDGITEREQKIGMCIMAAGFAVFAVGYILEPGPPTLTKRPRRR
ncbi:hypothetical protein [Micromonospora luteifusca]|uniref:hypothetical protein n=1 Tax=Micromonospora luteifusca TaxID=709860 RepID=UPI0033BEC7FE